MGRFRTHGFRAVGPDTLLLLGCGPSTAVLLMFCVRRQALRLSTLGLMQYIARQVFLIAVFVFHEPFGKPSLQHLG